MSKLDYVKGRIATSKMTSEYWGIVEGQRFTILKWYFSNGEGQLDLKDESGNKVTLPDTFFNFDY